MAPKKDSQIPADCLTAYEKVVATQPNVERKGAGVPYTSLNGHMFSYLNAAGSMALRLPEEAREAFLKKYRTTLFQAYGIVQKEYVTVPDSLLKNTKELKKYFAASYSYIETLKPKPTAKAKKAS